MKEETIQLINTLTIMALSKMRKEMELSCTFSNMDLLYIVIRAKFPYLSISEREAILEDFRQSIIMSIHLPEKELENNV